MVEPVIEIEVVYAAVDRQVLRSVSVNDGATVRAAVLASGIGSEFPELNLAECPLGIFGKVVADPDSRVIQAGSASRFTAHCWPIQKRFAVCVLRKQLKPRLETCKKPNRRQ